MKAFVQISKNAKRDLKKVPRHIIVQFDLWIEIIETEGFKSMQQIKGYNDHPLTGNRKGQRSSYLSRSWRVIYTLDVNLQIIVEVLEVCNHDY